MPSNHIGSETTIVLADPLDGIGTVSVLSQAGERERGASMPMGAVRSHTADGMVRSDWVMVETRDAATACRNVLSRSHRVLSMPPKRVPRRF